MEQNMSFSAVREMLLNIAAPVETEKVPLEESAGRVLAQAVTARENVPAFDRSPYDGYAVRSADLTDAGREHPVTLKILEEVPAGAVPTKVLTAGTAVKILTGAPIPQGADAVTPFEKTEFTAETVTLFGPLKAGANIVRAGEDVAEGQVLAEPGMVIDPGLAGTLAAQGIAEPLVYRRPKIGIISTGNEVVEITGEIPAGKIRNTNRYTLAAALKNIGCEPVYLGLAGDAVESIAARITEGLDCCDGLLLTGGVSVGDYDLTPDAMEHAGVELLDRGVDLKPGMACAYGVREGKLVCGLSGNPASSITNYYATVQPAFKKLAGFRDTIPQEFDVTLPEGFGKKSGCTRLLRGTLDLSDGTVRMKLPAEQGNVVISSTIGCNMMAIVPAGSGPVPAGTVLKGFML